MGNHRTMIRRMDESDVRGWNMGSSHPDDDFIKPLMHYNDNNEAVKMQQDLARALCGFESST
jgi:hypothetical protein